jgi:hypothetical protein
VARWGFCNALLGSWFIVGDVLALRGERRDRERKRIRQGGGALFALG